MKSNRKKAFTLIELLVAVIILSILTMLLVPMLSKRTELARKAKAYSDLKALQRAESNVEIDTGYYVKLSVLNDTRGKSSDNDLYSETIPYCIDPDTGLFVNVDLSNETLYKWYGPYITWGNLQDTNNDDIPEDPWGNPYILFTSEGMVDESPYASYGLGSGGNDINLSIDPFDQMTILSVGPDRKPGNNGTVSNYGESGSDDIYVSF